MVRGVDRFLLGLFSLSVAVLSLLVFAIAMWLHPIVFQSFVPWADGDATRAVLGAAMLLLFLVSARFLYLAFRRASPPLTVDQRTPFGDVHIAVDALENLATVAARRIRGVRELEARVRPSESGTRIALRVSVDGEAPIPDLTQALQAAVKEHVERIAGVTVQDVTVHVAGVAASRVGRVE